MLPGREGSVGVTAADNRVFVEAVLYRYWVGIPRPTGTLRRLEKYASAFQPLGKIRRVEARVRASRRRC